MTLPEPTSELSLELLKDPYIFDFVSSKKSMKELDFENALVDNITKFLLELGSSFAFVGKQYHLEVENEDYYCSNYYRTKTCTKHSIIKNNLECTVLENIKIKKDKSIKELSKELIKKYIDTIYILETGEIKIEYNNK